MAICDSRDRKLIEMKARCGCNAGSMIRREVADIGGPQSLKFQAKGFEKLV